MHNKKQKNKEWRWQSMQIFGFWATSPLYNLRGTVHWLDSGEDNSVHK